VTANNNTHLFLCNCYRILVPCRTFSSPKTFFPRRYDVPSKNASRHVDLSRDTLRDPNIPEGYSRRPPQAGLIHEDHQPGRIGRW
jgi:hypothetical protein